MRGQRQAGPGGRGRRPQHQCRVGPRVGVASQHDLAVLLHHAVGERPAHHQPGPAPGQPATAPDRHGRVHPAPGAVRGEPDRPPGLADRTQHVVGVEVAQGGGDAGLLLLHEAVQRPPGPAVQLAARVQQQVPCRDHRGAGRVHQLGRRERVQHLQVPQPAAGFLQVRLQQERQVAVDPLPGPRHLPQLRQPPPRVLAPGPERGLVQQPGQGGVAGDVPQRDHAEGGLQVRPGHRDGFRDGAHRVVQAHPGVPDRVPDRVGDPADVPLATVQQHQVEVRERGRLATPVAADRDERHAGRAGQPGRQPVVVERGQRGP